MPTVLIRGSVIATGQEFELRGFAIRPVTEVFVEESILGLETQVPISGIAGETEPPVPVLSARIVNAPVSAQESTTITTLEAELVDENLDVVELYDAANWTWAVDSGGGSFGGADNDELTLPAAPATVAISATHKTNSLVATAVISVVGTVVFTPDFYNLPAQLIEGQQTNPLRSRALNSDGTIAEEIDANWSYSIVSGAGSISGPIGNQVLVADPGSASTSITVRSTYTGSLNVSPNTDDSTTNVISFSPGDFPNNEPAGFTPIYQIDGSTKDFSTQSVVSWTQGSAWQDANRVSVVSDPDSKFGSAVEKRMFVGDESGWNGIIHTSQAAPRYNELYIRLIMKFSSNWQYHSASSKIALVTARADDVRHGMAPSVSGGALSNSQGAFGTDEFGPATDWYPVLNGQLAIQAPLSQQPVKRISRDEYFTFECHRWASLTPGTGGFRMWVDGEEFTNFLVPGKGEAGRNIPATDLTWLSNDKFHSQLEALLFWGGASATKNVNDFVRLSELYMSGRD